MPLIRPAARRRPALPSAPPPQFGGSTPLSAVAVRILPVAGVQMLPGVGTYHFGYTNPPSFFLWSTSKGPQIKPLPGPGWYPGPQLTPIPPRSLPARRPAPVLVVRPPPPPPGPRSQILRSGRAPGPAAPTVPVIPVTIAKPRSAYYWPASQVLRVLSRGKHPGRFSIPTLSSRILTAFERRPWPRPQILGMAGLPPVSVDGPKFTLTDPGDLWSGIGDGGATFTLTDPGTTWSTPET